DFGIVNVGLFNDAECHAPNSAVGVVGDSTYLRFAAIGFATDKETKQPKLNVSMRIVDEQGKPTMAKPLVGTVDSGISAQDRLIPMQFGITLNRRGRFTVELVAEDRVSGKTARINYAFRVLALE